MSQVIFGQPDDGIIQMCYVVPDIRAAMDYMGRQAQSGPLVFARSFHGHRSCVPRQGVEGGRIARHELRGSYEHRAHPAQRRGAFGLSRMDRKEGLWIPSLGARDGKFRPGLANYQAQGHDLVFLAGVPSGGSVAYMDTTAQLPGYVELIELGAGFEAVLASSIAPASAGMERIRCARLSDVDFDLELIGIFQEQLSQSGVRHFIHRIVDAERQ